VLLESGLDFVVNVYNTNSRATTEKGKKESIIDMLRGEKWNHTKYKFLS